MTEAIRAILKFGFESLNLDLLYATCEEDNIASIRVLQKNGMSKTGMSGSVFQYTIKKQEYKSAQ